MGSTGRTYEETLEKIKEDCLVNQSASRGAAKVVEYKEVL